MSIDFEAAINAFLKGLAGILPQLLYGIGVFVVTLLCSKPIGRAARRAMESQTENEASAKLVQRVVRWGLLIMGGIFALGQISPDLTGFVAGLGIAGIAVGYGLQDIARNFVAGLILLMRQPFNKGDAVKIKDYSGQVQDVNLRDTVIRTWDGQMVIIANSEVFSNAITNFSMDPLRRRTVLIGLGYGQDADRAMRIFMETLQSVPGVRHEPSPMLHAEALGNSTIQLAARFWIDQRTHSLLDVHSDVVLALNQAAERHGIELPYPIQTVRVAEAESDEETG